MKVVDLDYHSDEPEMEQNYSKSEYDVEMNDLNMEYKYNQQFRDDHSECNNQYQSI